MRTESAYTTKELRNKPFELIVAPGLNKTAHGDLYIDDGDALEQKSITYLTFDFEDDKLTVSGKADYEATLDSIVFLNQSSDRTVKVDGKEVKSTYDAAKKCIIVSTGSVQMKSMKVELSVSSLCSSVCDSRSESPCRSECSGGRETSQEAQIEVYIVVESRNT